MVPSNVFYGGGPSTRRPLLAALLGVLLLVIAAGCQAPAASIASPSAPATTSTEASASEAASPSEQPSASGAAGACLPEEVIAAVSQELDQGNLDTTPSPADVADALDTLELEGPQDEARDSFVNALRASPPDRDAVVFASQAFQANVRMVAC